MVKLLSGTLASRLLGFVRMLLMAHYFGGRAVMDAFQVAFMIPNLFRRVLGEQAAESAFLPTFKAMTAQGRVRQAWRTASVVLNWLVLLLALAAGLCYLFAPPIVAWILAPGFPAAKAAQAARLGRLMCPFLALIGLAAFAGSLLLAHGRMWAYSTAPVLFNIGWIAAILALHRPLGVHSLAVGVLVGGAAYLAATVFALHRGRRRGALDGRCHLRAGLRDDGARKVLRLAGPVCAAALVARCASVVDRAIASFLEEGSVAALAYAMPLVLLPFAVFGLSIGRAALVPLSERAAHHDADGFQSSLADVLHLGLVLLVPLSVGTALLAQPLAELLRSQTGRFGPDEARATAVALRFYALGLAGMGLVSILSRAMFALHDTATPFRVSLRALVLNAALSAALALTALRHGGIALATAVAMSFEALFLFVSLRRKLREMGAAGGFAWLWKPAARIALATAAMAAVVALFGLGPAAAAGLPARLGRVLAPACAGAVVYGAVMLLIDRKGLARLWRR